MEFPTSEFWNYSSQMWSLPEVESICLELQNQHDLNVNLLLFCCWIGEQQLRLDENQVKTLVEAAEPWETVIKPLRSSRDVMKQQLLAMPAELIDQTVKNITEMELNAEHMQQISLEKAISLEQFSSCESESGIECSLCNLKCYIDQANLQSAEGIDAQLGQLLNHLYQDEEAVQLAMMSCMAN